MAMEQILLVNPRPKRSSAERKKLSRAASGRRRNALGEFVSGHVRKNPRKERTTRTYHPERWTARAHPRSASGEFVRKNPRRGSSAYKRKLVHVRSYTRHNPKGFLSGAAQTTMDAGYGIVGAFATDLAVGYLPIPEELKSGVVGIITKVFLALGIGMLAEKVGFAREGRYIALGGVTVPMYTELKDMVNTHMPNLKLGACDGDMGFMNPGLVADNLGMYLPDVTGGGLPLPVAGPSAVSGGAPAAHGVGEYESF